MNRTKLYVPSYYRSFSCIADKCRHTCCVGWEIDVDSNTYEVYKVLTEGYGARIRASIDTETDPDTPHFRLCEGDRCPHLAPNGLCRIICELGEKYLCEICREHPRFYHNVPHGMEAGLGMACEEACRIILASDGYDRFEEIEELDTPLGNADHVFDATAHRAVLYATLSDRSLPYSQRLQQIEQTRGISPAIRTDDEWRDRLASLEYLNEAHRELLAAYSSRPHRAPEHETALERALAYFVFRHASSAQDESEFCAAVGLSLFCERLLASTADSTPGGLPEAARIISEELEYSEDNTAALLQAFEENV